MIYTTVATYGWLSIPPLSPSDITERQFVIGEWAHGLGSVMPTPAKIEDSGLNGIAYLQVVNAALGPSTEIRGIMRIETLRHY